MGMFGNRPPPPGYPPAPAAGQPVKLSPMVAALMPGAADPCILCGMAKEALIALTSGNKAQRIAFGGHKGHREVTYGTGNVKELRAEVRRLEAECELSRGRGHAVQAGPPPVPNGWGLGWPFGNPFGPRRY